MGFERQLSVGWTADAAMGWKVSYSWPMFHQTLANLILSVHALFIAFAVLGGLLVLRWRWVRWLHLPCMAWGATVIAAGWTCPLTPLENALRQAGGADGYSGGFIKHYLLALIYPDGLTREMQVLLAVGLLVLNVGVYATVWWKAREPT
jgi:Protein of Unknown function (DUF2784)